MNKEKISPDSLNEVYMDCRCANLECPVCDSENVNRVEGGYDFDGELASEQFTCKECNSVFSFCYQISHIYVDEDNYNTYERWMAENRDKQIDEILKD